MSLHVGIYIYDDVEVLDFAGPYEVFTTASRLHARHHAAGAPLFKVFTVGQTRATARARAGLKIDPDYALNDHPSMDCFIVPGGVVSAELDKPDVAAWIDAQMACVPLTASVCTGAFLLAQTGRLKGLAATTHWEDLADLQALFPDVKVREGVRWVDEGAVVTSAGIAAGMDMCLHLVARLHSRELAERTARQLEVPWTENR